MKKYILIIFATMTIMSPLQINAQAKVDSLKNDLLQLIQTTTTVSKKADQIREQMDKLQRRDSTLLAQQQEYMKNKFFIDSLLTTETTCRMLINYPMMRKYDPALIDNTLKIIEKFHIGDQEQNNDFCKRWLPVLKKYADYNEEIKSMIGKISGRVKAKVKVRKEDFQRVFEDTQYYQQCSKRGRAIPYIEDIKKEMDALFDRDEVNIENIQRTLNKL